MKIACSSASFEAAIAADRLTQLEWLDACATDLRVDGVVFEARHFPRTDPEYVAQLKKMATDLGLTVAGLACDALLAPDGGATEEWFTVAVGLGAPIAIARAPAAGGVEAWSAFVAAGKAAAAEAKRRNVTLALRNAAGTLCAGGGDCKRFAKDVDSSWVRYAVDVASLDPPESLAVVLPRAVVAAHELREPGGAPALDRSVAALAGFLGFLILDGPGASSGEGPLAQALDRLRGGAKTALPSAGPV
jgi:hypothetical protein